jgi:phage-related protein
MPAVWPVSLAAPVQIRLSYATSVADFGDGFEQRANKNLAYTRADGQGTVTSHKGRWEFDISMDMIKHANADPTKEVNKLWAFAQARLGGYEAFYFYNPAEAPTPDLTGISITGRYLVRFKEQVISLENFFNKLHRGQLTLIEVRA